MRTATFATEDVVDRLNEKFVLLWHNQSPDWTNELGGDAQPTFTAEQLAQYPEGGGGGNVRTYVVKPDGKVSHYLQGYWSAARFIDELDFALAPDDAHVERHRAEIEALKKEDRNWADPVNSAAGRKIAAINLQIATHDLARAVAGKEIAPILKQVEIENELRGVIS